MTVYYNNEIGQELLNTSKLFMSLKLYFHLLFSENP